MNTCKSCGSFKTKECTGYDFHDVYICLDCNRISWSKIDCCCKHSNNVYVFQYIDGLPKFIRIQCLNCGGCLNMSKPLSFKKYSQLVDEKYSFSVDRLEEWKFNRTAENQIIYQADSEVRYKSSHYFKYENYLKSEEWKIKREKALERDLYVCQKCKKEKACEVHHLTYDRLFNESLDDLISCCKRCHIALHNIK